MTTIKEKIRQIKYSRLKPEELFILKNLTDLEEYIHVEYPNSIFYKKDDALMFEWNQKNGMFWCNYHKFWSVLKSSFNIGNNEIKLLVKYMVEEYLIKKDITPKQLIQSKIDFVEEHLVKKDITPKMGCNLPSDVMEDYLIKKDIIPEIGFFTTLSLVKDDLIRMKS